MNVLATVVFPDAFKSATITVDFKALTMALVVPPFTFVHANAFGPRLATIAVRPASIKFPFVANSVVEDVNTPSLRKRKKVQREQSSICKEKTEKKYFRRSTREIAFVVIA